MAKPLKATENMIEEAIKELRKQISDWKTKLTEDVLPDDGKVKFEQGYVWNKKDFVRPVLEFTPMAWMKQAALVATTDSEIAWHGKVNRVDDSHYIIEDIYLYPQKVTAATVDPDEEEKTRWFLKTFKPEETKYIRFQGHSHVNMSPTPSGTDMGTRKDIVRQFTDEDDYYIFLIMNKSYKMTAAIYDMATNTVYDSEDIDLIVPVGDADLVTWCETEKKSNIKTKTYVSSHTTKNEESKQLQFPDQKSNNKVSGSKKGNKTLHITIEDIEKYADVTHAVAAAIHAQLQSEVNAGYIENTYNFLIDEALAIAMDCELGGYGYRYY